MTAATVEARALASELGLEHDTALRLLPLDTVTRRQAAGREVLRRLADLGLLRTLLVERDGTAPPLERIIATDPLYAELTLLAIA